MSRPAARWAVFAAVVLALLVGACSPHYPAGPHGTVTDRSHYFRKAGGWHYWLTVHGHRFRVTRADYRHCFRGSHYPTCTHR